MGRVAMWPSLSEALQAEALRAKPPELTLTWVSADASEDELIDHSIGPPPRGRLGRLYGGTASAGSPAPRAGPQGRCHAARRRPDAGELAQAVRQRLLEHQAHGARPAAPVDHSGTA